MDVQEPTTTDAPDPMATIEALASFSDRGAGSDAERRAAGWLARNPFAVDTARAAPEVSTETFWSRPNWALAHLWHVALAVAGSLASLASPVAGIAILTVALISLLSDALTGFSLGRRLTPERASQNVILTPGQPAGPEAHRARLILTANYDAPRVGMAYKPPLRAAGALVNRALRGLAPGWLAWLFFAVVWLLAVAILRLAGHTSGVIGAVQLPPTVGLLIGFALLLELATGQWSPGAGDNGSGVAVVLAVAGALAVRAPQHVELEVVLSGAGADEQIGLRRYLRARRRSRQRNRISRPERDTDTIVLGVAPCAGGTPHWWHSDGAFLPLRYSRSLRRVAEGIAAGERHLALKPHTGRGSAGAFIARTLGLPAITIGCLDGRGLPPRSHQKTDVSAAIDRQAIDQAIQFALLLIDGIDITVGEAHGPAATTPA